MTCGARAYTANVAGMHRTPTASPAPAVIRFRPDCFEQWAGPGYRTDAERAALIGVDRSLFNRVRQGKTVPGERFIAACLAAFPRAKFEDLFTVETLESVSA